VGSHHHLTMPRNVAKRGYSPTSLHLEQIPTGGAGVEDGPPAGEIRQEARSAATAAAASGGSSDSGDSSPSAPCSNSSSDIGSEVGTERKAVDAGTGVAAGGKRGRRDRDGRQRGWLWPPGPEWSPTGELSWLERETSRQYEEHN